MNDENSADTASVVQRLDQLRENQRLTIMDGVKLGIGMFIVLPVFIVTGY